MTISNLFYLFLGNNFLESVIKRDSLHYFQLLRNLFIFATIPVQFKPMSIKEILKIKMFYEDY